MKIILSRTDNLGDVVLTLPLAGFLKEQSSKNEIFFIGKKYTQALIENCQNIDKFLDKDQVIEKNILSSLQADAIVFVFPDKEVAQAAQKAGIPLRIGTSHRWWHWWYANKRINFSRKKSPLHEAQLNFKLLQGLGIDFEPNFGLIRDWYGLQAPPLAQIYHSLLNQEKLNVILHPKSKGSAREWHLDSYFALAKTNPHINFFITGTKEEGSLIHSQKSEIFALDNVSNLCGKLSLSELIAFVGSCDGLVACSTGPLHIAAALGIQVLGIYPPIRPMHPGRWQPIGKQAEVLVLSKNCQSCRNGGACACINAISMTEVSERINRWQKLSHNFAISK
ncbi:MAG: glycosyltransferase family 9 protein [Raineya sp.]